MWLLIGSFAATRKVIIFTDKPDVFNAEIDQIDADLKSRIDIRSTTAAVNFDLNCELSPWNNFRNKEAISEFEASQLNLILKKFVKQIVMRAS